MVLYIWPNKMIREKRTSKLTFLENDRLVCHILILHFNAMNFEPLGKDCINRAICTLNWIKQKMIYIAPSKVFTEIEGVSWYYWILLSQDSTLGSNDPLMQLQNVDSFSGVSSTMSCFAMHNVQPSEEGATHSVRQAQ